MWSTLLTEPTIGIESGYKYKRSRKTFYLYKMLSGIPINRVKAALIGFRIIKCKKLKSRKIKI